MDLQNLPFHEEGDVLRTVYLTKEDDDKLKELAFRVGSTPSRLIRHAASRIPKMCANGEL